MRLLGRRDRQLALAALDLAAEAQRAYRDLAERVIFPTAPATSPHPPFPSPDLLDWTDGLDDWDGAVIDPGGASHV